MVVARARVPKQVGRYHLVYELGTSYLGPLWAARIEGGDTLALLRLVSLARLDSDARVRLLEAAWQAMEVRDDRVLPVTDVVASDGELSVVSEYAEGLPLRAIQTLASVRRKPMSVPIALRFIVDLTDGVVALHKAMAELGDEAVPLFGGISADSVLVNADGRASLLDVAISSAATGVESLGRSPERVAYAAPEQLGEAPRADVRTDVFSVGTLAWELLANRRLFVGSDKVVAQKVLAAKVPKLEDAARKGEFQVPKRLGAAILRALSLEPGARFESMEAFREELDAAGVTPAEPEAVASYVLTIGDGAFARTRDALSLPPRSAPARVIDDEKPSPARTLDDAKKPEAARPNFEPKTSSTALTAVRPALDGKNLAKPKSQAKLAMPARPGFGKTAPSQVRLAVEQKAPAPAQSKLEPKPQARPDLDQRPEPQPSVDSKPESRPSITTTQQVSIAPKQGDGWRALDAPSSARSTPPAKIRPRQQTMIGLPPPANAAPEAAPPPPFTEPPPPAFTEPPPSSSEEPTQQYSREHLKQLAQRQAPSTHPPPPDVAPQPTPVEIPPAGAAPDFASGVVAESVAPHAAPSKLVSEPPPPLFDTNPPQARADRTPAAREVPLARLVSLRPTPRALSEIHTERPPPPEPEPTPPTPHAAPGFATAAMSAVTEGPAPPARVNAGLPPAPEGVPSPVRVAPAPQPARVETAERPAFSRPPPATVPASIYPSQVAPALIHDPRANRAPSIAPAPVRRPMRGIVLGVAACLALVAISAAAALLIMNRHGDAGAGEGHVSSSNARSDVPPRTEPAATAMNEAPQPEPPAPAPSANAAAQPPAVPAAPSASESARPEPPPEPSAAAAEVAAAPSSAAPNISGVGSPTTATTTPRAPTHAAAPHASAPRAARKPTKKRFVPSDI